MPYADYEFYTNEYFGNSITEDDFPRLSARASDYVYAYTQGISDTVTGKDMEMVKKATCAIAEIIQDETNMSATAYAGGAKLSSETVGSWSQSYSTSFTNTEVEYIDKRKSEALMLYLGNISSFSPVFRVRSFKCVPGGH